MLFFERAHDSTAARRRELGRIGNRHAKHHLKGVIVRSLGDEDGGSSARMAQAARMVIGLEFDLVAQILPEGDRASPIVRLDEYFFDAFSCRDAFN